MNKERSSNIELLRIIAMLMIIAYHIWCHCISFQLSNDTMYFIQPIIYKKLFLLDIVSPFGQIANGIFILISGYFMVEKKKLDLGKISKKLLLQNVFSTIILIIGSTIVYRILRYDKAVLIGTNMFNIGSWFIGYYFAIMVIAHFYLNNLLSKFDEKKYITFLLVVFSIMSLRWSIDLIKGLSNDLAVFITGIFLYSLGGYIKRYDPFKKIKTIYIFMLILAVYGFIFVSSYNNSITNISSYGLNHGGNIQSFDNYYIVPVILAICIFELFTRIKIRNNKTINFLGASTLMIYLLHDNDFVYSLWRKVNWIELLNDSPITFVCRYLIYILGTFEVGLIIYLIYKYCEKIIKRYIKNTNK